MKIILFANTDWYLYNFRLALAQALRERGDQVTLLSPNGPYAARLQELGFRWIQFPMARRNLNPLLEADTILRLADLYRRERPELVHHFTVKCVLYGSLVSRLLGIRSVVNSVTGLGYVFTEGYGSPPKYGGSRRRWLQRIVKLFYRILLRRTYVIFQNPDDQAIFILNELVDPQRAALIRGSGVDILRFSPRPEEEGLPVVILPARLLWDKGVAEFVQAARLLRAEGVQARFVLVGDSDPENPSSVPLAQIQEWEREAVIEWWGWVEDMAEAYAKAHIVCLPSYREGLPKTLIEAAACGRPIIASDVPGCREVVRLGENGLLVPSHDPFALADAIRLLIKNPTLRQEMGTRGRDIAVKEFPTAQIIAQTLAVYQSL
ncbi:MAG: glycosyltransferase family 1 protein [Anaerolineae bacterium CG_4_9_14_0_8_um_filter_58_9]|nr:MAG: glycosyltransferase family 1 protein [Anaerolineae bacterium CG_4_9_14_0_8_um_filter_58_9]